MNNEDWLRDPLMIGAFDYLKTTNVKEESYESWKSFHFDTRLKLNGADYFLRQLLGYVSRPDTLGFPNLTYYSRQWNLDAFFFELMAAYEILIQELNAIFECGEKNYDKLLYSKVKNKLPEELSSILEEERKKDWFRKFRQYRNSITHRSRNIISASTGFSGDKPWRYYHNKVSISYYNVRNNAWETEDLEVCETLFNHMIDHIHLVWDKIKEQRFSNSD